MAKNIRPRVPVALTDIQEEFRAQLTFLKSSCEAFDGGNLDEFRRIAIAIRILLYDQGQSKSVIGQLGLRSTKFMASGGPVDHTNLSPDWPLAIIQMTSTGATYLPALDERSAARLLDFDDWWTETIFKSGTLLLSRKAFILHVANQAGGAHVDDAIDAEYHEIVKKMRREWFSLSQGGLKRI